MKNSATYHLEALNPFGMVMQGRAFSLQTRYRYGFNGKELDADIGGDNYDFGARMYDARIGRWMAVDPLLVDFPDVSVYNYCLNMPLYLIDPDGLKPKVTVIENADGSKTIKIVNYIYVYGKGNKGTSALSEDDLSKYLKGGTVLLGDQKVIIELENHIINVKNGREARKKIDENGGYGVLVHRHTGNGRAHYSGWGQHKYDKIDIYNKAEDSEETMAHEIGHDLGFRDKYFDKVRGSDKQLVRLPFVGGLMAGGKSFNKFELALIASDVLINNSKKKNSDYPVDFKQEKEPVGTVVLAIWANRVTGVTYGEPVQVKITDSTGRNGKVVKSKANGT